MVAAILYVMANVLVYYKCNAALSGAPLAARIAVGIVYWVAALSFIAYMAIPDSRALSPRAGHVFYWFSTSWLVFTLYAFMFIVVFMLLGLFGVEVKWQFAWAAGLSLLIMAYGFTNFSTPEVRHLTLDVGKPVQGAKSVRVVAVSDVHLGYGMTRQRLERLVETINDNNPDIVLIAGDLIDMSVRPLIDEKMDEPFAGIHAPMGIYMVPGNHEFISGIDAAQAFMASTPVTLLRDTVVSLPSGLQIVGRDDNSNRRRKSLDALFGSVDTALPVIVMDHQPNDSEVASAVRLGADLVLCGHTHNGQVWPLNLITGSLYKHSHGYYHEGTTNIYVSSGYGLWGPPYRIGSDSELVVIDLNFD